MIPVLWSLTFVGLQLGLQYQQYLKFAAFRTKLHRWFSDFCNVCFRPKLSVKQKHGTEFSLQVAQLKLQFAQKESRKETRRRKLTAGSKEAGQSCFSKTISHKRLNYDRGGNYHQGMMKVPRLQVDVEDQLNRMKLKKKVFQEWRQDVIYQI